MSDLIEAWQTQKIQRLIDRQIRLRVKQLTTLENLSRSIEHGLVHGRLKRSDIAMIQRTLESLK